MRSIIVSHGAHPPWTGGIPAFTRSLLKALIHLRNYKIHGTDLHLHFISLNDIGRKQLGVSREEMIQHQKLLSQLSSVHNFDDRCLEDGPRRAILEFMATREAIDDIAREDEKGALTFVHLVGINPYSSWLQKLTLRHLNGNKTVVRHIYWPPSHFDGFLQTIYRAVPSGCPLTLAPTSAFVRKLLTDSTWYRGVRCEMIQPATDTEVYKRQSVKSAVNLLSRSLDLHDINGSDAYNILYMGSLHPSRFPCDVIMNTIKKFKKEGVPLKLIIISRLFRRESDRFTKILHSAKEKEVSQCVSMITRPLDDREKCALFSIADVYLSLFRAPLDFYMMDPPMSVLEAMSCGCIVIATNFQGLPILLKNGVNGILVDGKKLSPTSLKAVIHAALDDRISLRISVEARRTIELFYSLHSLADNLGRFYGIS